LGSPYREHTILARRVVRSGRNAGFIQKQILNLLNRKTVFPAFLAVPLIPIKSADTQIH
jgi:hypothetical protein